MAILAALWRYRQLIYSMSMVTVRARYQRTVLGLLWSMLGPVAIVLVIGTVYGQIMGRTFQEYVPFLFAGLFPWRFLSDVAASGCAAFINAEGYVKQIAVPLVVYPARTVVANFIHFLFSFVGLAVILLAVGAFHPLCLLTVLPGLVLLLVFGLGVGLFQAVVGTIFRDYQHISAIFIQALFYATPIIYPPELMDVHGQPWVYQYNPFHYLILVVRQPLLDGALPGAGPLLIAGTVAVGMAVVGLLLLDRVDRALVAHL